MSRRGPLLAAVAMALVTPAWAQDSASLTVGQIEVLGVKSVPEDEVVGSLEIDIGDRFDRGRVVRSAQNIQALYNIRGYEQTTVRTDLLNSGGDRILRFSVHEGAPTRVASVKVVSSDPALPLGAKLQSQLRDRVLLGPGDLIDQEKIAQSKRAMLELLGTYDYIGARFGEVIAHSAIAPTHVSLDGKSPNSGTYRWVDLEIPATLAERVKFGFRGNEFFTASELHDLINEQRVTGLSTDYVSVVLNRILAEYRKNAFADTTIQVYTFEHPDDQERQVTFEIREGERYRIQSVDFEGNSAFKDEDLLKAFKQRSSTLVQRGYYVSDQVDQASAALIEWIRSQGYLFARVITRNQTRVIGRPAYKILIYLYEGDQTMVQSVHLKGFDVIGDKQAKIILGLNEGEPLNLYGFTEGLESLKAIYRGKGYLDFRIVNESTDQIMRYAAENRLADVTIEADAGPLYKVTRIDIEGLTRTRSEVVRRELQFKVGDVLEEPKVTESQTRLRRLGIFSVVTFRDIQDPDVPDGKIMRVSLQEGTPGVYGGGVGYRNDLGARVFGQVGYANLYGRNHSVSLNTSLNRNFDQAFCDNNRFALTQGLTVKARGPGSANCFLEYQAQLSYTWPWFALGETTFRPLLSLQRVQYYRFDSDIASMDLTWERKLGWKPLTGLFTYSLERVRQFNAPEVDEGVFRIGSITPGFRLDFRDNPLAPTRGAFFSTSYEIAREAFLSQAAPVPIAYDRWQFRSDFHIPLGSQVGWYLSFRTGIARNRTKTPAGTPDDPRYQIPIIKQFTLGGVGSLRGFREQQLNLADQSIRGYMSFVNYRTQIDFPFVGALKLSPFLDAGKLRVDDFGFGRPRYGAGLGFRYQSPVGPVNFDWGFNLRPQPLEDRSRFYFSVGII